MTQPYTDALADVEQLTQTRRLRNSLYLVALYPFGSPGRDAQFVRGTLRAVLVSGLAVASIGLLECAAWNGKVLWTVYFTNISTSLLFYAPNDHL